MRLTPNTPPFVPKDAQGNTIPWDVFYGGPPVDGTPPEEVVSRWRTRLLQGHPFFAHLLMRMELHIDPRVPMAAVDAFRNIRVNPEWVRRTSAAEGCATLLHEVLHPALNIHGRMGTRRAMAMTPTGPTPLIFIAHDYCFPAGTVVSGAWGSIESLQADQVVIGQAGETQVVSPMSRPYTGKMTEIGAMGIEPFLCTPEHRVLAYERVGRGYPIVLSDDPVWVAASDLKPKVHYLVIPRLKGTRSDTEIDLSPYYTANKGEHLIRRWDYPLNESTAELFGLYVAEGDSDGTNTRFTLHEDESDIAGCIKLVGDSLGFSTCNTKIPERHAQRVTLSGSLLARMFSDLAGTGAKNKRIPDVILHHENLSLLRAFLRGYYKGDGHTLDYGASKGHGYATVSRSLALQVQLAYARLGQMARVYHRKQKDRKIHDTFIPGGASIWFVEVNEGKPTPRTMRGHTIMSYNRCWKVNEDYILTPVQQVDSKDFDGVVYNIETKDNTYCVNNAVVHNCINLMIDDEAKAATSRGYLAPVATWKPAGLLDERFRGMSVEEVYDLLYNEAESGGRVYDTIADYLEGEGDSSDAAQEMEAQEWRIALVEAAIKQEGQDRGSVPAGIQKYIKEFLEPRIDWEDAVSRWIGENGGRRVDTTYRKPSRRASAFADVILSATIREGVEDIVVLWDTSGSMYGREERVLADIISICDDMAMAIRVICIDTQIHSDQFPVTSVEDVDVKGGGGSDFSPAFRRLEEENYRGLVLAFTDGGIGVPGAKPDCFRAVLWVLMTEHNDVDPTGGRWGEVIRVDKKGNIVP